MGFPIPPEKHHLRPDLHHQDVISYQGPDHLYHPDLTTHQGLGLHLIGYQGLGLHYQDLISYQGPIIFMLHVLEQTVPCCRQTVHRSECVRRTVCDVRQTTIDRAVVRLWCCLMN